MAPKTIYVGERKEKIMIYIDTLEKYEEMFEGLEDRMLFFREHFFARCGFEYGLEEKSENELIEMFKKDGPYVTAMKFSRKEKILEIQKSFVEWCNSLEESGNKIFEFLTIMTLSSFKSTIDEYKELMEFEEPTWIPIKSKVTEGESSE